MAVSVQVFVSMGGFPIYNSGECFIMFQCDQYVKEWHRTILPCVLYCEFNGTIYYVDVLKEESLVFCVLYYKCVILISLS